MSLTNYPNGLTSFGIPLVGNGIIPSNVGTYWFVNGTTGIDGNSGLDTEESFKTIQYAVDQSNSNDVILIAPGSYDETVTISRTLTGLALVGLGNLGDVRIAPTTVNAGGLIFNADNVTLINMVIDGEAGATASVTGSGSRFRAYSCRFEGSETAGAGFITRAGTVAQIAAGTAGTAVDVNFYNCEFARSFYGFTMLPNDSGVPKQVLLQSCRMHNISNTHILGSTLGMGMGSVRNLEVIDCWFDVDESGVKPADYINVSTAFDTGLFKENSFALATNAAADLKIGAGIFWVANSTEAGVSTARPA